MAENSQEKNMSQEIRKLVMLLSDLRNKDNERYTEHVRFMNETMKEEGDLNLVRHGNHFILTDKDKESGISVAVFSNKQDPELQKTLNEFLSKFCNKYASILKNWNGTRSLFDGAVDIAEEVFGHLAPSRNLIE